MDVGVQMAIKSSIVFTIAAVILSVDGDEATVPSVMVRVVALKSPFAFV